MNSGELPLKTRRKVSLALEGPGAETAAHAARAAAAISKKKRSREVLMVVCDGRAVIASIRCAATRHALRPWVEFRAATRQNALRREASLMSLDPAAQIAAVPVPLASGKVPMPGHPRHLTVQVSRSSRAGHAPLAASGACRRVRGPRRKPSLPVARSCRPRLRAARRQVRSRRAPQPASELYAYS